MSSDQKRSLDELMQKLSPDSRAKVVDFADYLFEKNNRLSDASFVSELKRACQWAFEHYAHPANYNIEDLQEEVLMRVWQRPRQLAYESLFETAAEILRAVALKKSISSKYHGAAAFDNLTKQTRQDSPAKPARKLRQNWAGGLSDYGSQYTSLELQKKALEWRGD
jgi:hypothetical protein